MFKIRINDSFHFEAKSDETIFEAAKRHSVHIAHNCLSGRCSECAASILSGKIKDLEEQSNGNNTFLKENVCLTCISKPATDMELTEVRCLDYELPPILTTPIKLNQVYFIGENLALVEFRIPPSQNLQYLPGQYMKITLDGSTRSYSIFTSESNLITFLIRKYPNGKFSNYFFTKFKANDLLIMTGPYGTYYTEDFSKYDKVVFMSTGTGISPNIAMLKHIVNNKILPPHMINFIHGERNPEDHYFKEDLIFLNVNYIACCSRSNEPGFFYGYIQDACIELNLDIKKTVFFVCGNSKMTADVKEKLYMMGASIENLRMELFTESN